MNQLLEVCLQQNASDIHIAVGRPPSFRISGSVKSLKGPVLTPDDTAALMKQITPERGQAEVAEVGSTDFAIGYFDKARFRVNVFKQKQCHGMVLRLIPQKILTFEDLGLPEKIKELCNRPRGLCLVTGPTGSGKSTTLAAMIDYINQSEEGHILTLEDPIEFTHPHKKSVVNQREIHVDCPSFAEGLRRALREDPDVILVGEMRDLETISQAISAAETGHLVFGTLHTTGAARTIDRIIDAFPTNQQEMVRTQLAGNLIGVISQALVPKTPKGRCAAYEIMLMNAAISNLIRENKSFRIDSTIQTSANQGMILLDDSLFGHYKAGTITFENMMAYSKDPAYLTRKVSEAGLLPAGVEAASATSDKK
ncbi:MAG: type IV pilus twitching motility protein PilT [Planctomycetes bacterium]|nr:type IV pilus twitching motility protein PilT [Planctomycetota bacterium]